MSKLQTKEAVLEDRRAHGGLSAESLLQVGYAALGVSEVDTALACFARVLVLEPERVDPLNDCGGIYGRLGRHEEAVGFFQRALLVEPERADVLNNLGLALALLGRHEEASGYLARALELRPHYLDALCNLGYSCSELGRYEQALVHLERALAINSAHLGGRATGVSRWRAWGLTPGRWSPSARRCASTAHRSARWPGLGAPWSRCGVRMRSWSGSTGRCRSIPSLRGRSATGAWR